MNQKRFKWNYKQKKLSRESLLLIIAFISGLLFYLSVNVYNLYQKKQVNRLSTEIIQKTAFADSLASVFDEVRFEDWKLKEFSSRGLPIPIVLQPLYYFEDSDRIQFEKIKLQMANAGESENDIQSFLAEFKVKRAIKFRMNKTGNKKLQELVSRMSAAGATDHEIQASVDSFKTINAAKYSFGGGHSKITLPENVKLFHLDNSTDFSATDSVELRQSLSIKNEIKEKQKEKQKEKKIYTSKILTSEKIISLGLKFSFVILILLFPVRYIVYASTWSIKTLRQNE